MALRAPLISNRGLIFCPLFRKRSANERKTTEQCLPYENKCDVQNFAARIITKTRKFDHITPVLQELRWLPMSYYLMYTVGVLAFKCVKGLAPSYLSDRFVTRSIVYDRNTRNKAILIFQLINRPQVSELFLYRAIKLWNSLPRAIIAADSLRTFKKKLREFLFESFFVS